LVKLVNSGGMKDSPQSSRPITSIALSLGYSYVASFTRAFER
jgi:AraC-like DNA-binding protein